MKNSNNELCRDTVFILGRTRYYDDANSDREFSVFVSSSPTRAVYDYDVFVRISHLPPQAVVERVPKFGINGSGQYPVWWDKRSGCLFYKP